MSPAQCVHLSSNSIFRVCLDSNSGTGAGIATHGMREVGGWSDITTLRRYVYIAQLMSIDTADNIQPASELRAFNSTRPKEIPKPSNTMASRKKILVTGATGKQGGAVIKALQENSPSFQILALTRSASSNGAKALASKPNITIVEGDHTSMPAIFEKHKPIYGVFSVTVPGKVSEEDQAKPLIDESVKNGVEHFVFSSVDRGGERSDTNPTNIPHFSAKHRIEEYLKEKSDNGKKMPYTILRPVAFMDNLTPDFMGKGFTSMWAGVGAKPLQLISCRDIGLFAARAFNDPAAYKGRSIALAGDELNIEQARKVFKETMGSDLPETFGFVGSGLKFMIKEVGTMFNWFKDEGYGADIQALRKEEPRLQTFSQWLKETSKFSK
ncbi:hypothetical protein EG329_013426 [Mollisiaceae sp. DMI_Dod_QoI]|nr:hypothetical protein EG329_013426 [Helotiales sp. DMI_Dod_QoI]